MSEIVEKKKIESSNIKLTMNKKKSLLLKKVKFYEKIVQVKRVTKVVKGGKKMTFQATVIVGDKKRKIGVGVGRADDVNRAIEKGSISAKKKFITIPLTFTYSIPHRIMLKSRASKILLRPASEGTGIIAGGAVRTVLELGGLKNVVAKQFGSKNILNNAKLTMLLLKQLGSIIKIGKNQSSKKRQFYKKIIQKNNN
jgi:small subunit ribosomal protein S5